MVKNGSLSASVFRSRILLAALAVHLAATLVDGDFERKSVHVKLLLLGTLRELTISTNTEYVGYRSRVNI